MILRHSTNDRIRLTSGTAADLDISADFVELDQDTTPPGEFEDAGSQVTVITGTSATTIVDGPADNTIRRNVKKMTIANTDSADTTTVTVERTRDNGTTWIEEFKCTLAPSERALYANGVWFVFDSNGGVKQGATAATETAPGLIEIASVAEMEAASDTTRAVTPGYQHRHPSAAKFWCNVTGGGTPALQSSYNVTSIADTGTGRMTVTIGTDFSSGNWACSLTTFTTTTTGDEGIPNIDSKAAGTVEAGNRIVTPAFADPNVGYDLVGFGDHA